MKARRAVTSVLLFLTVGLVYVANGRSIGAGDTLPARYLPFSLLRARDFTLDEFPALYGEQAHATFPVQDGVPYFLRYRDGHYVSAYSPGPAVLALPVYAWPVLMGVPADVWAPRLEKVSAAAITALSVVFLFWALGGMISRRWALGIAAIYAFGTSSWSVSSQALWQHGPSQLCVALLLVCLVRAVSQPRFFAYAGFAAAAATVMRPTNVLIVLPVAAYLLYARPKLVLPFGLFALPPLIGLLLYNLMSVGSVSGEAGHITAPVWALFTQVPMVRGLAGVLLSPSRGLFVYSPVLLFAVIGLLWTGLRGPSPFKPVAVGAVLTIVVVGKWFVWWGGHSWGPRLLADIAPILCFFLYPCVGFLTRHRLVKGLFVFLAAVSIGAHGLGVFFYDYRWDALADVRRSDAALWSWRSGPLAFYARRAAAATGWRFVRTGHAPTSADSPAALAASYAVMPTGRDAFIGETIAVSVEAVNTGGAVWLASTPDELGEVHLGWRWARDGVDVAGGRVFLSSDVSPGQTARFAARIAPPPVPGDYVLSIDLVSERVTWFAAQGQKPVTLSIRVRPPELARLLAEPPAPLGSAPTARISTDRVSYRRGETLRLTVEARNPGYPPDKLDVYLLRQGPDGAVWFYDGRHPPRADGKAWHAVVRELPMPALVIGRFQLPLADVAAGAYRWHVVVTEAGTYRPLAKATAVFSVEP